MCQEHLFLYIVRVAKDMYMRENSAENVLQRIPNI